MAVMKMTAAQVARKVIENKELFILDVRNQDAFEDWKIDGHKFEYLNIPYFDLLDGVEGILEKFLLTRKYWLSVRKKVLQ